MKRTTGSTRRLARTVPRLVVSTMLLAGLAGCGSWNPWADPEPTTTGTPVPTETATSGATPTQTPTPETTPLGPLSGIWDGTWVNAGSITGEGTFTLMWGQQGGKLVGSIAISGSNCLGAGGVDGTIVGDRLRFGAVEGAVTFVFEGTVTNPDTLSGTYRSEDCGTSGAMGAWSAKRRET